MPACRILVRGLVQGVFFRAGAQKKAVGLGLTGWARNTEDGAVEIHAEGSADALAIFEEWCGKGPEEARVTSAQRKEAPEEALEKFEIRY